MAKPKKARNKKYNPKQAHVENARRVTENSLGRIAFIGASNRRIQPFGGRAFQYTVARNVRVTVSAALAETLFEDPRPWQLWMCHYVNGPEGVEATSAFSMLEDYTLGDFNEHIMTLVNHSRPEDASDEDYIGFAFFCAPNDRWDFSGPADDRLIENFMASGVLEKDTHVPMSVWPVDREELIIKLMADHGKFDAGITISQRGEGDDYTRID